MYKSAIWKTSVGLFLMGVLLWTFMFSPNETVQAFNQENLVRVVDVYEVDGKIYYERAPITNIHP